MHVKEREAHVKTNRRSQKETSHSLSRVFRNYLIKTSQSNLHILPKFWPWKYVTVQVVTLSSCMVTFEEHNCNHAAYNTHTTDVWEMVNMSCCAMAKILP